MTGHERSTHAKGKKDVTFHVKKGATAAVLPRQRGSAVCPHDSADRSGGGLDSSESIIKYSHDVSSPQLRPSLVGEDLYRKQTQARRTGL